MQIHGGAISSTARAAMIVCAHMPRAVVELSGMPLVALNERRILLSFSTCMVYAMRLASYSGSGGHGLL